MANTSPERRIRAALWGAAAAGLVVYCALYLVLAEGRQQGRVLAPGGAKLGGSFQLTDHEGKAFSSDKIQGYPFALFFGFMNCPDVCPTTLLEMTNRLRELGRDGDRLKVLFVSVDPERDTPGHLKAYLASFDPRIVGLTGNAAEIASVVHAYRAHYEKVATSSGYTLHHTSKVYLMDRHGQLASTIGYEEGEAVQREKLRLLLAR